MIAWLERIDNRGLRERTRALLLKLQLLSEAPAAALGEHVSTSAREDSEPQGVAIDLDPKKAPPKDRSLFEHFAWRFERASSDLDVERLCEEAEVDLEYHQKGLPRERIALQAEYDEKRDIDWLLEHGAGLHAGIISARMGWPIGWVRITRERNAQDPDWGRPRAPWRELGDDHRESVCRELAGEGLSQRDAAKRLGIGKTTLVPYWPATRKLRRVA